MRCWLNTALPAITKVIDHTRDPNSAETGRVCWPFPPNPTQYNYRCRACGQYNHAPDAQHCPGDERDDTADQPF